jgi:hypothetical protein
VEQAENKISGNEESRGIRSNSKRLFKKMLRQYEWNKQGIWDTMKRPNL